MAVTRQDHRLGQHTKMRCPGRVIRNSRGTVTGDMGNARLRAANNSIQPPETQPPEIG